MVSLGLAVRVFANGPGDLGSIPGRVIPKTQKMVLDNSLLNTQHYKVRIKGKLEQSRERSRAPPLHLGRSKLSKREPSGHPRLWSPTLLFTRKEKFHFYRRLRYDQRQSHYSSPTLPLRQIF